MAFLEIGGLRKAFGAHTVVHDFSLAVDRGEFISFLGPSGCGKTTILRMVAGFEAPTAGGIAIDGRNVTPLPANRRRIGMVFQAYALFPNMTVAENIGFGLKIAKLPAGEIAERVREMLDLIKLPHLRDRYPRQLSGGQQQRVALARALAGKPQVLLLDEPLSALDAKIRISLREEIKAVQRDLGVTTIFVTHDQEEALSMSDRIVVMNEGRAEQIGTPFEIYNYPRTRFVASFVGTLNILNAHVADAESGLLDIGGQKVQTARPLPAGSGGQTRAVAVRPEAIAIGAAGPARNALNGVVEQVSFLGALIRIRLDLGDQRLTLDAFNNPNQPPPEAGARVGVTFGRDDVLLLDENGPN